MATLKPNRASAGGLLIVIKTTGRALWLRCQGGSVEELAPAGDELIASRPGADQLDRNAYQLADSLAVLPAVLGEVIPAAGAADVLPPAGHLLVDRLAVLVVRDVGDRVVMPFASEVVAGADLQPRVVVADVETHECCDAASVQPRGIAGDSRVEPPDTARPAGDRSELVAPFADLVSNLVEQLGGERAVPDPRRVRLEYSDGQVHFRGRNSAAGERAAGGRVGARHVGICAEVEVQHRGLRALEEDVGLAV